MFKLIVSIWLVSLNPSKSKAILFSKKRSPSVPQGIIMNGTPLHFFCEVKHLGVILDSKLDWSPHVNSVIKKGNKILYPLQLLKYKLPSSVLLVLYKSYIRPLLEYASPVWGGMKVNIDLELEKLQNKALLAITGCIKSTSILKMQTFLDLESLKARRDYQRLCIFYKIVTEKTPSYLMTRLQKCQPTRPNPRNFRRYIPPTSSYLSAQKSFFNHTISDWNELSPRVRHLDVSLSSFKKVLRKRPDLKLGPYFFQDSRPLEIKLNRFMMNHSGLNGDLYAHGVLESPNCPCGAYEETKEHFIFVCPLYDLMRRTMLAELRVLDVIDDQNIRQPKKAYKAILNSLLKSNPSHMAVSKIIQNFINDSLRFD